jgi:hypothetical protein
VDENPQDNTDKYIRNLSKNISQIEFQLNCISSQLERIEDYKDIHKSNNYKLDEIMLFIGQAENVYKTVIFGIIFWILQKSIGFWPSMIICIGILFIYNFITRPKKQIKSRAKESG